MSKLFKPAFDLIIEDIVGDTSWHGETYSDAASYENVEKLEMLLWKLFDKVQDNARIADNAVATASGQKLQKQAQNILERLKEEMV